MIHSASSSKDLFCCALFSNGGWHGRTDVQTEVQMDYGSGRVDHSIIHDTCLVIFIFHFVSILGRKNQYIFKEINKKYTYRLLRYTKIG